MGDVSYPADWLDHPENVAALGMVEVQVVGERKDENLFDNLEVLKAATLTITATPKAPAALRTYFSGLVQKHLDQRAQQMGYDSILSAVSYATSTNPKFQGEGIAFLEWRDQVWAHCADALDEVTTGVRPVPTELELLSELPQIALP